MASNEMEVLETTAAVETLTEIKSRRMDRRRFMTAVGVAGAATGAVLASRSKAGPKTVSAAGPSQNDALNFALNLEYLEATFYSYVTTGADLPGALTIGSGAITGNPAKLTFTGPNAAQITDMLNEIYYDELNHVIDLKNLLGTVAIARPAINLAAYAAITASNALGIARLFEDVGVTAYTGALSAGLLSGSNLTYAAQIMSVEAMHAGAIRLVAIQNPSIAPDYPTGGGGVTFNATAVAGSPTLSNVYYVSATLPAVGNIITGPGLSGTGLKVTAISSTKNTATTGTTTGGSAIITTVASLTNVAIGNIITGTNIATNATITAFDATAGTITMSATATSKAGTVTTATALTIGNATITLSGNASSSATTVGQIYLTGNTDSFDVAPYDPGTAALSAAGPSATGGFFATAGASTATSLNPAGVAFARTSSQVLAVLYGAVGVNAVGGANKGGFFVNGVNGVINTV